MTQPLPSIPGYTVLAVAGQGGMGTVYKAEQASPRRLVALKVLRRAAASDLSAFRQEAQVIAGLEHPHIVPLYAFGELAALPFLVLRYLTGGTVADQIRQGPIELLSAERWIASVADALDFAHQRGIIHRDIKPSNILLDELHNAYLTDFGIAGTVANAASDSALPTGSAAYMAPEQGRGEAVDGRGDLYSLAVTLFEMLTGQKPYLAETAFGVMVRHSNDPIPSARALNPTIPPAVDDLIQWGMAKDPAQRPQTAAEFSRLLRQALAQPTVLLRPLAADPGLQTIIGGQTLVASRPTAAESKTPLWIGIAIGLLALVCIGGLAITLGGGALAIAFRGTPTPVPTTTKLPTTPIPSATVPPALTSTPDPDGGVVAKDGELTLTARRKGVAWFSPLKQTDGTDMVVEANVQQVSGPALNIMAIICRWQDNDNYTAFAVSGDGTYSIWQQRAGQLTSFVDWTASDSLKMEVGTVHQLRAVCAGSRLTFEVDGAPIGKAIDPDPLPGDAAVMAGLREEGELVVKFEKVKVTPP